ncbi:MAG: putative toxin-antitoxin system toxin component, PIN family [Chloroflexi bacterium]|nr:putative toxin-antitoxin system toxin component, PIN family [Chloroflexota bacterium]
MRIVLDTNVLVSMILGGRLQALVDYWDQKYFAVLVSAEIMAEYVVVLARPKFGLPRDIVDSIIAYIERKAEFVVPTETITEITTDPTDNRFLECAVSGRADFLVSGDPDLNLLERFREIPIVAPRDFLDLLERKS